MASETRKYSSPSKVSHGHVTAVVVVMKLPLAEIELEVISVTP